MPYQEVPAQNSRQYSWRLSCVIRCKTRFNHACCALFTWHSVPLLVLVVEVNKSYNSDY